MERFSAAFPDCLVHTFVKNLAAVRISISRRIIHVGSIIDHLAVPGTGQDWRRRTKRGRS